jgi:DNA repair exonuclease SbcCD nuclease subunit
LKIFHTADLHLGSKFNFLGEKAGIQRKQLEESFAGIVEKAIAGKAISSKAITAKADIFLIAGDTFDSPFPGVNTISFVKEQIEKLLDAGIYTAVIAGNHDYVATNSVLNSGSLMNISNPHFKIFSKPEISAWEIAELNTVIIGASLTHPKNSIDFSNIKEISDAFKKQVKIGLFHGSIDLIKYNTHNLINLSQLKSAGLDYTALGDWHNQLEVSKMPPIYYPGAHEMINTGQTGDGKFLVIEIDGENKSKIKITSETSGKRFFKKISLDLGLHKTEESIIKKIKEFADKNCVLEVEFEGFKEPGTPLNIIQLQEMQEGDFFVLKLIDKSKIKLNKDALSAYPKDLLPGKFIATVIQNGTKDGLPEEIINKALQIGLNLLQDEAA